jgi:hypothetical protein
MAGPDFLCVGAQKGGTGWLYEQLRDHPDFWMPPLKELHYFDRLKDDAPVRSLPFARKPDQRMELARANARNERDRRFLDAIEKLSAQSELDLPGYSLLFQDKAPLISGDITPGYSTLPEKMIEHIIAHFPDLKVIFIARDPVERAWSQLSMYVRRGLIEQFDANDVDAVMQHLRRPEVVSRSNPSEIVARWVRYVRPGLFRVYFFDDLKTDPAAVRRAIIEFLGGDPEKSSGQLSSGHNAKAGKRKIDLTEKMRSHLAGFFEKELKASATELGGAARGWPGRYGF